MSNNYFPIGTPIRIQGHSLIYLGYIDDRGVDDRYGVHLVVSEEYFTFRSKVVVQTIYSSTTNWLNYTRVARNFVIDTTQQLWSAFPYTEKPLNFLFIKTENFLPLLRPATLEEVIGSLELELLIDNNLIV